MSLPSRLTRWLGRLSRRRRTKVQQARRREFVYLDEVSLYSLLGSHKPGVAETFTESDTASLTTDLGGSLGASGTGVSTGIGTNQTQSFQVVRKATVQTHFRELYEIEQPKLVIGADDAADPGSESGAIDLEAMRGDPNLPGRIVESSSLSRGELIEVNVELDSDPLFRLSTVINSIRTLVDENAVLFEGTGIAQLDEMRAVAQVLESLLEGLVPVRGRLIDYAFSTIEGEDVLVHTSTLERMADSTRPIAGPAYVASVAQHSFFWQDIRRTLFTRSRYTMLCRIMSPGLSSRWRPSTAIDLLGALAPEFEAWMEEFANQADTAMAAAASETRPSSPMSTRGESVLRAYLDLLAKHHGVSLGSEVVEDLVAHSPQDDSWLGSVDSRRSILKPLTKQMDAHLNVETPSEVACNTRQAAVAAAALQIPPTAIGEPNHARVQSETPSTPKHERFIEAEIVAIYW